MLNLIRKVESIALQAGQDILLPAFIRQTSSQTRKQDGSIVTETDEECQDFLQLKLGKLDGTIGFLGEEMTEQEQLNCLHQSGKFWCVDPLDGTGNFTTPMPLFAISIGLIDHGKPVLSCIYDPVRDEMFSAVLGHGLQINGKALELTDAHKTLKDSVGFVDFKRLNPSLATDLVTHQYYRSQRNLGTCALEWAWLAAGRAQFIVHGGQKLWDYAAGLLLAEEAGCLTTDFNGKHPFSQSRLSCPIIATADKKLSKSWLNIVTIDD